MNEQSQFTNKGAIVTGAGSGIGRAVAHRLASLGARVLAVDMNMAAAERTAAESEGEIHPFAADVSVHDQVKAYADAATSLIGEPRLFFNNAGVEGVHKSIVDTTENEWRSVVDVNLNGMFFGLKNVLPLLQRSGGGAVVNTGSILSLKGAPDRSDYVVTKHAVLGLTRSAAAESATHGIRVNCICPGPVDTPLMSRSESLVNPEDPNFEHDRFIEGTPLRRYGSPEEIAELVVFLLREDVGYQTGSAVTIDGGITAV
ncbi:SDR family oxidoreductase [Rhodococcus fascians]|uniref:SDR family NAD(P)-dependent oxidoreductase n=1 Tax=Rhodococcoides fascians TaxID=1828 RepID=UPI0019622361|nr:SDR family oxidoreductase [Rhodococcus fascians]MBM7245214.1 SDR family oxidoreductase [Rhodococcus fascians]MBY3811037.1 SDR family oxidoreductase [Rhodococcus fascians]MBY3842540.1 SDR family oxidoreductase [Rhodococcus fascians]MBY3845449.1 SDR family oxidoreductase [Rhodococcus fascians]MBY3851819.1 SDR family oxidoreductase [Rhodococcus fascians]